MVFFYWLLELFRQCGIFVFHFKTSCLYILFNFTNIVPVQKIWYLWYVYNRHLSGHNIQTPIRLYGQWLTVGRWFSPGTSVSSINKTARHNITEIVLKVALNTISLKLKLCVSKNSEMNVRSPYGNKYNTSSKSKMIV
jgi:hypothetical protein